MRCCSGTMDDEDGSGKTSEGSEAIALSDEDEPGAIKIQALWRSHRARARMAVQKVRRIEKLIYLRSYVCLALDWHTLHKTCTSLTAANPHPMNAAQILQWGVTALQARVRGAAARRRSLAKLQQAETFVRARDEMRLN